MGQAEGFELGVIWNQRVVKHNHIPVLDWLVGLGTEMGELQEEG